LLGNSFYYYAPADFGLNLKTMDELIESPITSRAKWTELKAKLKTKFPALTDTDLQYDEGKQNVMFDKLQVKLGKTKAELDSILKTL
jgi:uncharacterized protein YjbJ (UPF0337 family)